MSLSSPDEPWCCPLSEEICGWQCSNCLNVDNRQDDDNNDDEDGDEDDENHGRSVTDGSDNNLHNCQPVHGEW